MLEKSPERYKYTKWNGNNERKSSFAKEIRRNEKGKSPLKKSGGILCKGNQLEAYRFIDKYHKVFGIRWLLKRLKIYPNAYYNYRKHRKATYYAQKKKVQQQIKKIYHSHNGVDGYRNMTIYLECIGYSKFVASGF